MSRARQHLRHLARLVALLGTVLATCAALGGTTVAAAGATATAPAAAASALAGPENLTPPTIAGKPRYHTRLAADPGTWSGPEPTFRYRWLRDGEPIGRATRSTYKLALRDIGHRVSVRVTAVAGGERTRVFSDEVRVRKGIQVLLGRPKVKGTARYLHTVRAGTGRWERTPKKIRYQWLRNGRDIRGATKKRYRLTHRDVGKRLSVRVIAKRRGYKVRRPTAPRRTVGHRVPVRHTVRYHVETRGRITTSLKTFRRQANASLNDPRGWRAAGIAFKEVKRGGGMTLVLAESSWLPRFSSGCSSQWSCRVGRYVVINQLRWKHASPAWNRSGGSLRGYRHMVVNHETGHWLGHGHRGCPGPGRKAAVMQQQSISLAGCRFNAFPTPAEWNVPRF